MDKGHTINVLDHGYVRYVDHMGSDERIVEAARISYKSPSKGPEADAKLIHYLWKNLHSSPFEMCKLTLNIKMPIFVARQYLRHRMQNINECSARYTELPNEFYIPNAWREQDKKNKQGSVAVEDWNPIISLPTEDVGTWGYASEKSATELLKNHCKDSYFIYQQMLSVGVAREMARMVLPVNIYTEFYACWDLKNLLHFITLRDDAHAQFEIQEYGKAIKTICRELFPATIGAYEKYKFKCVEVQ